MNNRALIFRWLRYVLFFGAIVYLVFNDRGVLKYYNELNRVETLRSEIRELQKQNERLEQTIDSLQRKIPSRIEQTARENLDMKKPNEVVIKTEVK